MKTVITTVIAGLALVASYGASAGLPDLRAQQQLSAQTAREDAKLQNTAWGAKRDCFKVHYLLMPDKISKLNLNACWNAHGALMKSM